MLFCRGSKSRWNLTSFGGYLMLRRAIMLVLLIVCATTLAVAIIGPSLGEEQKKGRKVAARKAAPFVHSVIFYLKKDAPENEVDALIDDAHQMLAKIPG